MKRILLACGSGICTSTAVNRKLSDMLDKNGFKGQYKIDQCKISEMVGLSDNYDFCIATTMKPTNLNKPFVSATTFLTGIGMEQTFEKIKELMES